MPSNSATPRSRSRTSVGSGEGVRYPYEPDYGVPPGDLLEDYLSTREISARDFARRCGRSAKLIVEIISGKAPVEPETALQFEKVLDVDASIWLNIEATYRLHLATEDEDRELAKHSRWAKSFPIDDLVKLQFIRRGDRPSDLVRQILRFFEVGSVEACKQRFSELAEVSYRHSPSFTSVDEDLLAWLRIGEIRANEIACEDYDRTGFLDALHKIRSLTLLPSKDYLPKIERLCADVGVAFVVQGKIGKIALSGISRWLSPRKALIQQTLRHKRNDHFWFTFFHEAAHLLHHSRKSVFIDFDNSRDSTGNDEEEREANNWAANFLIPQKAMERFVLQSVFTEDSVKEFADELGIAPGIVVGQLQNRRAIGYDKLVHLCEKIEAPE